MTTKTNPTSIDETMGRSKLAFFESCTQILKVHRYRYLTANNDAWNAPYVEVINLSWSKHLKYLILIRGISGKIIASDLIDRLLSSRLSISRKNRRGMNYLTEVEVSSRGYPGTFEGREVMFRASSLRRDKPWLEMIWTQRIVSSSSSVPIQSIILPDI